MPKGSDYDRLLGEFLAAGGDLSLCPFDAGDYRWREPPYEVIGPESDPVVEEKRRGIAASEEEWEREYKRIGGEKA